jgi:hypothetical protein
MEPLINYATIRVSDSEEWIDIECRMADGRKGAFVQVDAAFPELANVIVDFLNSKECA